MRPDQFEKLVLRPLQLVMLLAGLAFLLSGKWWLLAACVAGIFYLGSIGAKLHPLQSVADLAQGPTGGPAARAEAAALPPAVKLRLVSHACTRVGLLLGIAAGVTAWAGFGLAWYVYVPVALITCIIMGAALKLAFKAV